MKYGLGLLPAAAGVAIALAATAGTASAQLLDPNGVPVAVETGGTIVVAPAYGPPALGPLSPVCELRRQEFSDEWGWRVRYVRLCR